MTQSPRPHLGINSLPAHLPVEAVPKVVPSANLDSQFPGNWFQETLATSILLFNPLRLNQAVFAFRRYEDASLRYTGIESHEGLTHYGLYDTVVGRD